MNDARHRLTIRPSRTRLVIWGICLAVIAVLLYRQLDLGGSGAGTGKDPLANEPGTVVTPFDADSRPPGPPAVRFGVMPRAAHLVALSGLEGNFYAAGIQDNGWIEVLLFDRSPGISRALREGDLDVATIPIRDAVALFLEMGDHAPRVVAGAAVGDEMYVAGAGVTSLSLENFGPVNVGVLELPALDISAVLRLGSEAPPTVILTPAESLARCLLARTVDLVVAPEPLASQAAVLSGSHVFDPRKVAAGRLAGGAVLVATASFLAEHRDLLDRVVAFHEVSAYYVDIQPDLCIARAMVLLGRAHREVPPEPVWQNCLAEIEFGTDIPTAEIEFLLQIARDAGLAAADTSLAGLVVPEFQESARKAREEQTEQK